MCMYYDIYHTPHADLCRINADTGIVHHTRRDGLTNKPGENYKAKWPNSKLRIMPKEYFDFSNRVRTYMFKYCNVRGT